MICNFLEVIFMEKTINARGQACPKPLVMAREKLRNLTQDDKVNVIVDNIVY